MQIAAQTLTLDLTALSVAGDEPFSLMLADGFVFKSERIVRRVPEKRIVCQGVWQAQPVFAKIFLGSSAGRHMQRDRRGSLMLTNGGIATPALLYAAALPNDAGQVLLYEAISPCSNVEEHLSALSGYDAARLVLMLALSRLVAQHHQAGLLQTDLYFKNFLVQGERIYTLDGDGIRYLQGWRAKRKALSNLACLISKQDSGDDHWIPQYYRTYCAQRGWVETVVQLKVLTCEVANIRRAVAREYAERKVLRECSDVRVEKDFGHFMAVNRAQRCDALNQLLNDPDTWLDSPACQRLKNGNTCTVGLIVSEERKIVIKRYNIKSFRHGLARMLRQTRASVSWSNAHLLQMLGIPTATPLALIERRWGPLRRESYFLADYVEGPDIAEAFAYSSLGATDKSEIAAQAARLLHRLYLLGVEHGDFKATNLKIVDGKPLLLDLDAMRLHRSRKLFEQRHARDLRRFLKNWQHDPTTLQLMKNAIEAVYGCAPVLKLAGI
jgi:tRNA A-37 threonylcarbamoyl transferase component Bud32